MPHAVAPAQRTRTSRPPRTRTSPNRHSFPTARRPPTPQGCISRVSIHCQRKCARPHANTSPGPASSPERKCVRPHVNRRALVTPGPREPARMQLRSCAGTILQLRRPGLQLHNPGATSVRRPRRLVGGRPRTFPRAAGHISAGVPVRRRAPSPCTRAHFFAAGSAQVPTRPSGRRGPASRLTVLGNRKSPTTPNRPPRDRLAKTARKGLAWSCEIGFDRDIHP